MINISRVFRRSNRPINRVHKNVTPFFVLFVLGKTFPGGCHTKMRFFSRSEASARGVTRLLRSTG